MIVFNDGFIIKLVKTKSMKLFVLVFLKTLNKSCLNHHLY